MTVRERLRGFFWMDAPMREAESRAFRSGSPGFEPFRHALAAREAAVTLLSEPLDFSDGLAPALHLLVEAVRLALSAHAERADGAKDGERDPMVATELPSVRDALAAVPPDELRETWARVARGSPSLAPIADHAERLHAVVAARNIADRLLAPLEAATRTTTLVKLARSARIGVAAVAIVSLGAVATAGALRRIRGPNLALHRPTATSSAYPGFAGSAGAVDGDTHKTGFHTEEDDSPWLTIDLGEGHRVGRVVVYNRSDGFAERAVPLVIELGADGNAWSEAARQDDFFRVWTATFSPRPCRWVRVRAPRKTWLHLAEVEVYAR